MSGFTHESPVNASVEWYTPRWLFDAMGVEFDMDVASPEAGPVPWVPARRFVTPSEDGLVVPYEGLVWCNPPYGKLTAPFLGRVHAHGNGLALVFARTDTRWFHAHVATAYSILFFNKRIRFVDREEREGGSPGAGSMLVAYGREAYYVTVALQTAGYGFLARARGIEK